MYTYLTRTRDSDVRTATNQQPPSTIATTTNTLRLSLFLSHHSCPRSYIRVVMLYARVFLFTMSFANREIVHSNTDNSSCTTSRIMIEARLYQSSDYIALPWLVSSLDYELIRSICIYASVDHWLLHTERILLQFLPYLVWWFGLLRALWRFLPHLSLLLLCVWEYAIHWIPWQVFQPKITEINRDFNRRPD